MGCSAQGSRSTRFGALIVALCWPLSAYAQSARPAAFDTSAAQPATNVAPAPLDPPAAAEPTSRPAFLQPRAEAAPPSVASSGEVPDDFLTRASPWVDFTLTSFYFDGRVGNFLNLGAQFGVYALDRLRLSGRFVTPLERVEDGAVQRYYPTFPGAGGINRDVASRSISMLYGASLGLVVTNSRSFVFGPNLGFLRTDVEDYGTAIALGMPFEWTTKTNLRVGFELSLGHAVGGSVREECVTGTVSCGQTRRERPGGTAVVFQFYMGWALGRL